MGFAYKGCKSCQSVIHPELTTHPDYCEECAEEEGVEEEE